MEPPLPTVTVSAPHAAGHAALAAWKAALSVRAGEEGTRALELLEDTLRHEPRSETTGCDRWAWVSRNAVPPRSVWRIYEAAVGDALPRLLASLLLVGLLSLAISQAAIPAAERLAQWSMLR